MKSKYLAILFIASSFFLFSCGSETSDYEEESLETTIEETNEVSAEAENLIFESTENVNNEVIESDNLASSVAGTQSCGFAFETKDDFVNYVTPSGNPRTFVAENGEAIFFRADGSIGGSGDAGEESMWEGSWVFQNGTASVISIAITMQPSNGSPLSGSYKVEMFPDEGALILNCVDYFEVIY